MWRSEQGDAASESAGHDLLSAHQSRHRVLCSSAAGDRASGCLRVDKADLRPGLGAEVRRRMHNLRRVGRAQCGPRKRTEERGARASLVLIRGPLHPGSGPLIAGMRHGEGEEKR